MQALPLRERGTWGAREFRDVEAPARAAAVTAIGLDADNAEARAALGHVKYIYDWDWEGAEKEIQRALQVDPGSLDAHFYYAMLLMALGRHSEAITEIQNAEQLDPLSAKIHSAGGRVFYRARKYEEAILHLKRAIELDPRDWGAYYRLGDVYTQMGRYDEALAMYQKEELASNERVGQSFKAGTARICALAGKRAEALQWISDSKASLFDIARVYAILGDKDEAFRILEKAVEVRGFLLVFVKEEPNFDGLHSDPRWKVLLRRMNFPGE